jgi:hypothetical protein
MMLQSWRGAAKWLGQCWNIPAGLWDARVLLGLVMYTLSGAARSSKHAVLAVIQSGW